jgi:hypothetical protein
MLNLDPTLRPSAAEILAELDVMATQVKEDKSYEPLFVYGVGSYC